MESKIAMSKNESKSFIGTQSTIKAGYYQLINYIQFNLAVVIWKIMTYDRDIQMISIGYITIFNMNDVGIK